jgi:hypothetical protein
MPEALEKGTRSVPKPSAATTRMTQDAGSERPYIELDQ